jgi:hypothetical protein
MRRSPWPTWRVTIEAHRCERWIIPSQRHKLVAVTAAEARLSGIREAHRALGMPPWRPLIRLSWPYSSAERLQPTTTDNMTAFPVSPLLGQHELWAYRRAA